MRDEIEIIYQDEPRAVRIQEGFLYVTLGDGRVIGTPLDWYRFLEGVTPEVLQNIELLPDAIYWRDLDEGLSIDGMLQGVRPRR